MRHELRVTRDSRCVNIRLQLYPLIIMSESNECPCPPKTGHFSWNELIANDTAAAANFYGKLFGWQTVPFTPQGAPAGAPPYTLFKMDANDMGVGGMAQPLHQGVPTHWVPYVVVDDVDASLVKASELGAKVILPTTSIGEVGRIAVIKDPQGATIGLHEFPK